MSGIILFDGVCNLCNQAVDFVIKHDKKRLLPVRFFTIREWSTLKKRIRDS